jgi:hypothetical protein
MRYFEMKNGKLAALSIISSIFILFDSVKELEIEKMQIIDLFQN